jgi:23S rRNA (adenine2503-C2)-methyltransferase
VRIETPKRVTLCLSSQVGCGYGCRFCRTAAMGFRRHLSAAEIVDQVHTIAGLAPLPERVNIVFMGMGEPLANYDAVVRAIDILVNREGLGLSSRRITVSTVGVVPGILRLARERPRVRLAVSLAATTDEVRSDLMPVNRRYSLAAVMKAVREHAQSTGQRATFEYVLLAGVNDTPEDARRLVRLANQVESKVNLIPYNPTGLPGFERATDESMEKFARYLAPRIAAVTIRRSQGKDIFAACGQLAQPIGARDPRRRRPVRPAPAGMEP